MEQTKEVVRLYFQNRLSAPQYAEFLRVLNCGGGVSRATRRYWVGKIAEFGDHFLDQQMMTEGELQALLDGLVGGAL